MIDYVKRLREKADLLEKSGYATCGVVQDYRGCARIIEKLSEQPQADKWIPIEERLPEAITRCLITLEDGRVTETIYDNICGFVLHGEATAWMPLPAPYKKEGAE